jgi:hypothetical protein
MNQYAYYIAIIETDIAEALVLFRERDSHHEMLEYQDANHNTYTWRPVDLTNDDGLTPVTLEDAEWFTQYATPVDVQLELFKNEAVQE